MTIEAILKNKGSNVFTIRPDHSVSDTATLVSNKRIGAVVVCDAKGQVVGMVSERDIVRAIADYGKGALDMSVRNIMTSPAITCAPAETVKKALETMSERRIRHLPVVDQDRLVGIISIGDAIGHRLQQAQYEVDVLRDIAVIRK
jgi:CBS domain-containing protein